MKFVPRAAVLHVNSAGAHSTSPTMRIARYVAQTLGIPLIHDLESARANERKAFDVLFVKYGLPKFSDHRDYAMAAYAQAPCIVNLENDYTMEPDVRFRRLAEHKSHYERWSTVEGRTRYVNWNVLTWMPPEAWRKPLPWPVPSMRGLLYYGAHRTGRVPYFHRYLRRAPYPVTVSTFRGAAKFAESCGLELKQQIIGPFRKPEQPAQWPLTVYIEDEASHTTYCSPANRFYECLQLGMAQAIDVAAAHTLQLADFEVPDNMVVNGPGDVKRVLAKWDAVRQAQRKLWHRPFHKALHSQLRAACRASFGAKCLTT